jgi:hypothetical protein
MSHSAFTFRSKNGSPFGGVDVCGVFGVAEADVIAVGFPRGPPRFVAVLA